MPLPLAEVGSWKVGQGFQSKRYLIFAGITGEQKGGWLDFKGTEDTIIDCLLKVKKLHRKYKFDWFFVVDLKTCKIVRRSNVQPDGKILIKDENE